MNSSSDDETDALAPLSQSAEPGWLTGCRTSRIWVEPTLLMSAGMVEEECRCGVGEHLKRLDVISRKAKWPRMSEDQRSESFAAGPEWEHGNGSGSTVAKRLRSGKASSRSLSGCVAGPDVAYER